jgi:hypothetical protein
MITSAFLRIVALLLAAFLARPAHARLGETEAQAKARYGAPVEGMVGADEKALLPGAVERVYNFEGWRVRSAFVVGITVRIQYVHIENNAPKKLDEVQIKALLEAEKGKFSWREARSKQVGYAQEFEKLLKAVANINKWERTDHAMAELVVGIAMQFSTRDADELEKKLAKTGPRQPAAATPGAKVPKF